LISPLTLARRTSFSLQRIFTNSFSKALGGLALAVVVVALVVAVVVALGAVAVVAVALALVAVVLVVAVRLILRSCWVDRVKDEWKIQAFVFFNFFNIENRAIRLIIRKISFVCI
jgi:hypothetical protein